VPEAAGLGRNGLLVADQALIGVGNAKQFAFGVLQTIAASLTFLRETARGVAVRLERSLGWHLHCRQPSDVSHAGAHGGQQFANRFPGLTGFGFQSCGAAGGIASLANGANRGGQCGHVRHRRRLLDFVADRLRAVFRVFNRCPRVCHRRREFAAPV
jgi:hypothetical protein